MTEDAPDIQRALGRIEGSQQQLLDEFKRFHAEFIQHVVDDKHGFESTYRRMDEQISERNKMLSDQAKKIEELSEAKSKMQGIQYVVFSASWLLASLLGALGVSWAGSGWPHK